jgi:cytoskeletal protein RodZ
MSEPTQEQPAVTPTVSTAPERSRWHVSRIPGHLGRARTSTVVLAVLFLAIGTLYLNIRPETTGTATTETGNQVPASTTAPAPEPTATTTPAPETTTEQSTTTAESTTTGGSTDTTTPEGTTESTLPTPTATTTPPALPSATVSPPPG